MDQVRVVGIWACGALGLGRYGAWLTQGRAETGQAEMGRAETGQDKTGRPMWERPWQLSLENSKINQIKRGFRLFLL